MADSSEEEEAVATLIVIKSIRKKRRRKSPFSWVRQIYRERELKGVYNQLLQEMKLHDREFYFRFLRISPDRFEHLLSLVGPSIQKRDTNFRNSIPAAERLALTLRYLASGDSQQSLLFNFRISASAISRILSETAAAIWENLSEYVRPPMSKEEWLRIENEFDTWNFTHCIGAIDGKHIAMENPPNSGSLYYNYKGFYSIILLAVCDAKYNFILVDVGQYGSNNDCGVLSKSQIGMQLENQSLQIPPPTSLAGCKFDPLPYFLVGDEAFPLKKNMMRPYPGKLKEPERVYKKASVRNVENFTLGAIALHNYLRQTEAAMYCPNGFVDSTDTNGEITPGEWRRQVGQNEGCLYDLCNVRGSRPERSATEMREAIKDFVNSEEGAVEWQYRHVRRT
ncbi:putative nuclease HARBI1 [Hydractinia symbiolongicarpus]|uniref:putative nuclease HARBI1 n=1 Tax=Hydractinia symbiolongicarpus TaxID=13093 RepID=UPI00254F3EF2|nr:putative nuclease HARBI1 [Hydractinia symbiolongicarpus]